jgi:6-phosphogluconolactonase
MGAAERFLQQLPHGARSAARSRPLSVGPDSSDAGEAESPDAAARQYERTLRTFFGDAGAGPDLLLLGMGSDGHTASLFPQSPALEEHTRWVVPAVAPVEPRQRITLTIPAINRASNIFLLVAGEDKQSAFVEATSVRADPRRCPGDAGAARGGPSHLVGDADAIIAADT